MDLDHALRQFDLVEANLAKLETVLKRITALVPSGIAFMDGSPEDREHRELCRSYRDLIAALPAIDGWKITAAPPGLDAIAQMRLDANEVGEIECMVSVEQGINEPDHEFDDYRSRFNRKRRQLVRRRLSELVAEADALIGAFDLALYTPDIRTDVSGANWDRLRSVVAETDRLLGTGSRSSSWNDLRRHLSFAKGCDIHDIVTKDWPVVRHEIARMGYEETEPLPVAVADLDELTAAKPAGRVATALSWDALDDEAFERLIFCLISDAPGYENPAWLTRTRAPDRGRDLSVTRVRQDALAGVSRERVIIQCKHWLSKSVPDTELADSVTKMVHWEPPSVDVLIVVTSGRFTTDAVAWQEKHNQSGKHLKVELWPESHLERLLAQRPHIVAEFHLR
jgi:hypothetical protein